ncbi:protein phosphatase CheZ [Kordiimonas gwangyangensis]|uniref:protein phosphatase CheZ n=1 Tax=Kordiimonas gwangyangensis TaxID=288022 RepID=UPI0003640F50|nr:protein phosphatase CheZ [Kordiimonas gwangyangensis]
MAKQAAAVSLEDRAAALRQNRGDNVAIDDITHVVGSLVKGTTHDDEVDKIATELRELLSYIGAAKNELMGMQPKSLSNRDIPDAGEQLDAIVKSTEDAAETIMDAAETVGMLSEEAEGEMAEKLEKVSTELFQASSFQDLTGQRITKVMRTLGHLEERLNALADAIGDDYIEPPEEVIEVDDEGVAKDDSDLLHGPQLEGEGNSQAEIDAILASFD